MPRQNISRRLASARATVGSRAAQFGADSPQARDAREDLDRVLFEDRMRQLVRDAPSLDEGERARIAKIVRPVLPAIP